MLKTSLYPLRVSAGPAIDIARTKKGQPDIRLVFQSPEVQSLEVEYDWKAHSSYAEAQQNLQLSRFLPSMMRGQTRITPGSGVASLPMMPELPFQAGVPFVSLMALAKSYREVPSRALRVHLELKLAKRALVGGICFGGYAYLPTHFEASGRNLSNYGLPREWRLTPLGTSADGRSKTGTGAFLDAENSVTKQELLSHSGAHFVCCDPTDTDFVELVLSDWPMFAQVIAAGQMEPSEARGRYGFFVPYLYVFEYLESVRYRSNVSVGLLAARHMAALDADVEADYTLVHGHHYFPFTAASLTNGARAYSTATHTRPTVGLHECFISGALAPNEDVTLYCEQAQENNRCLSGFHILPLFAPISPAGSDADQQADEAGLVLPNGLDVAALASLTHEELETRIRKFFQLQSSVHFIEALCIRVWEIDPPEGMAPTQVPLGTKYTVLLADLQADSLLQILQAFTRGIRFERPTSARYLAVELVNRGSTAGRVAVLEMRFVQSAHVSASARPSRAQKIRGLNFRLVGESLGEDLSRIGADGFNFAVEHWTAGERKSVLFRAVSLFDLVHSGVGRLQTNVRRRASEFETSEYGPEINDLMQDLRANYDQRTSKGFSLGWRRTESGPDLTWTGESSIGPAEHKNNLGESDFASVSNQQTRSHVSYVYPASSNPQWTSAANFANALGIAFQGADILAGHPLIPTNSSSQALVSNFARPWRNVNASDLLITGTTSVVQSPYSLTAVMGTEIHDAIDSLTTTISIALDALKGRPVDPARVIQALTEAGDVGLFAVLLGTALFPLNPLSSVATNLITAAFALNGFTANISVQPGGVGASFGSAPGNLLPVITQSATLGNQGTISRQATRSDYSYNQVLVSGGDDGDNVTYHNGGIMKRRVVRAEDSGNACRVRGGEVMWQGHVTDVVSGLIPLNVLLPALASKEGFRSGDDSIRVRLGSGVGASVSVDFWFDMIEEVVRDDY